MKNSEKTDRIEWSDDRWKEMLIEQRKFLWRPEAIADYARWMQLKHGMKAVDVGCGLGFLGYTYWPHFGNGGHYIGVDESDNLVREATEGARIWVEGGKAEFVKGDAYNLPFTDSDVDWVMCQTLLIHLENPEKALQEMIRILKPGGLILCMEPDNLSGLLVRKYFSAADFSNEDSLLMAKVHLTINDGRKSLGRGDTSTGNRVAHMLAEFGLEDVDVRMKDTAYLLEPPYASEQQQHRFKHLKKFYTDARKDDYWKSRGREEFLAGGGDIEDFNKHCKIMEGFFTKALKQMDDNLFSMCGGNLFYVVKARKPA